MAFARVESESVRGFLVFAEAPPAYREERSTHFSEWTSHALPTPATNLRASCLNPRLRRDSHDTERFAHSTAATSALRYSLAARAASRAQRNWFTLGLTGGLAYAVGKKIAPGGDGHSGGTDMSGMSF